MTRNASKKTVVLGTLAVTAALTLCSFGCAPTPTKAGSAGADAQPDENSGTSVEAEQVVMEGDFTFSADSDCAICHTNEGDSLEDSAMPASNHAALDCTTCHSDTGALATAHADVQYGDKTAKRLKTTQIDDTACFNSACHGSMEELAQKTEACAVLTDKNGTVVNPHAMPENEDHDTIDCGSCHSMHSDASIEDTAQKACKGCHHMDVYECNTCHD